MTLAIGTKEGRRTFTTELVEDIKFDFLHRLCLIGGAFNAFAEGCVVLLKLAVNSLLMSANVNLRNNQSVDCGTLLIPF